MAASEQLITRLALFGRTADALTRQVLRPEEVAVSVEGDPRPPLKKEDGHFAIIDLEPSATAYRVRLGGPSYQTRVVDQMLPTLSPVQVTFPGEDEFYFTILTTLALNRVTFDQLAFVPAIAAGAAVIGQGGFTATLAEALEGRNVNSAVLSSTAGLLPGQVLRIVRSPNLLVRPGPYYPFPADTTVVAMHVVENEPAEPAIAKATIVITQVDGAAPTAVTAGTLPLSRFALTVSPGATLVLDAEDRSTTTNDGGDAVFYFSGSTPLASLTLDVSKAGFQAATVTINVTTKARTFKKVPLTKL